MDGDNAGAAAELAAYSFEGTRLTAADMMVPNRSTSHRPLSTVNTKLLSHIAIGGELS